MTTGTLTRDRVQAHPRLVERRQEVERDLDRRRRRRLGALAVVSAGVLAVLGLAHSPMFDVDHVVVVGAARTSPDVVAETAGIKTGDTMISVDSDEVTAAVEALPWVADASVSRDWPGTVRISVTEREAIAQADDALVDVDGRVLGPLAPGDALPEVRVGDHDALDVVAAMPAGLRGEVRRASSASGGVVLHLGDHITVRLGDQTQLQAKFDAVAALLDRADRATIDTIDVTVPTAATLTRTEGGST